MVDKGDAPLTLLDLLVAQEGVLDTKELLVVVLLRIHRKEITVALVTTEAVLILLAAVVAVLVLLALMQ